MYNRYVPQQDGSFRCSRHPDPEQSPGREPPSPPVPSARTEPSPPRQEPSPPPSRPQRMRPGKKPEPPEPGIGAFLRQLLPKNFDSGDLLVVLLLLLMSSDNGDDQNTALLTLALYLFL